MTNQNLTTCRSAEGYSPASLEPSPQPEAVHPTGADPRIEDYLDHVCAPLVGHVPYQRRRELRAELRAHVEAIAEARRELDGSEYDAVSYALSQFGNPAVLARQWLQEWHVGHEPQESMAQAVRTGIVCAAPPALCVWLVLHALVGESVAPTPQVIWVAGGLFPLVVGAAIGGLTRRWHLLAGCAGVATMAAISGLMSAFLNGSTHSLTAMSLVLTFFWLPVCLLAAPLAGYVRKRLERKRRPWRLIQA